MWDAFASQALFDQLPMMGKILFAAVLGLIMGYEREVAGKPNGLRTSAIIASVTCLIILLGAEVMDFIDASTETNLSGDPARILHAVIVSIGFIGGGVILKNEKAETVENLTSAATILMLAVLGASVALEQYYVAIFLTLLVLFINKFLAYAKGRWMQPGD